MLRSRLSQRLSTKYSTRATARRNNPLKTKIIAQGIGVGLGATEPKPTLGGFGTGGIATEGGTVICGARGCGIGGTFGTGAGDRLTGKFGTPACAGNGCPGGVAMTGSVAGTGLLIPPEMIRVYSLLPAGRVDRAGVGSGSGDEKTRVAPAESASEENPSPSLVSTAGVSRLRDGPEDNGSVLVARRES